MHDKILQNTCPGRTQFIYTDGSGIQEKIGAATFEPAMNAVTQQHLGSENHFNVFAAEVSPLATAAEVALHSTGQNETSSSQTARQQPKRWTTHGGNQANQSSSDSSTQRTNSKAHKASKSYGSQDTKTLKETKELTRKPRKRR